jgi:DNA-binding NarL/FixJ family response regulator
VIRLLIADDHPIVRDGLRGIFEASDEFEVVGEAVNGRDAVDRAAVLQPDVVLMDLRMPEMDGVTAIKRLAERGIKSRVLVLTTFDTDSDVVPAIEAGATGYLLKDSPPEDLLRGVRAAARGEAVLSPSVATRLLGQVRAPAQEPLSQRELDVLGMIAEGASNKDAAARLYISEATVKTHVLHIFAKLGVNDRAAAVAIGFQRGMLPRPLSITAVVLPPPPCRAVFRARKDECAHQRPASLTRALTGTWLLSCVSSWHGGLPRRIAPGAHPPPERLYRSRLNGLWLALRETVDGARRSRPPLVPRQSLPSPRRAGPGPVSRD